MKTALTALKYFVCMSALTGLLYPLCVWAITAAAFPAQAGGSIVTSGGKPAGSALLAQSFSKPEYFWPRPSSVNYSAMPSGASNQSITDSRLLEDVKKRRAALEAAGSAITADMLFASASGLDPHISPEAARLQIARVAASRGISEDKIKAFVDQFTEPPQWGFLGQVRVNVLLLNVALDKAQAETKKAETGAPSKG